MPNGLRYIWLTSLRRGKPQWGRIAALPARDQRWAATVLVANDLVLAMPGLVLSMAFQRVAKAVLRQTVGTR